MKLNYQDLLISLPKPVVTHIQGLERMRQDFVANVSHELRTPLTVIHGYVEALMEQENIEKNQLKKILLQMQQQTLRMENLIEDLLLLAHLENKAHEKQIKKRVNIAELLHTIQQEAKTLSADQQHEITLEANPKILLNGIEKELRSLFSNIIFNAVKYTPAHGKISIEWGLEQSFACFKVKDTGIGIAHKHLPRITERFYRVDKARSRSNGGTGLGLAIAKHVLINHQGKLEIESTLGKGSTFTCIFADSIQE